MRVSTSRQSADELRISSIKNERIRVLALGRRDCNGTRSRLPEICDRGDRRIYAYKRSFFIGYETVQYSRSQVQWDPLIRSLVPRPPQAFKIRSRD